MVATSSSARSRGKSRLPVRLLSRSAVSRTSSTRPTTSGARGVLPVARGDDEQGGRLTNEVSSVERAGVGAVSAGEDGAVVEGREASGNSRPNGAAFAVGCRGDALHDGERVNNVGLGEDVPGGVEAG